MCAATVQGEQYVVQLFNVGDSRTVVIKQGKVWAYLKYWGFSGCWRCRAILRGWGVLNGSVLGIHQAGQSISVASAVLLAFELMKTWHQGRNFLVRV